MKRRSSIERFWSNVIMGLECWEWQASLVDGYGQFMGNGQTRAHRFSWELVNGAIPEGMHVLHRCDNRRCVRPDHLFLGTHQDNMDDMVQKGRSLAGDRNPSRTNIARMMRGSGHVRAKINEAQALEIRLRYQSGTCQRQLAEEYGISMAAVYYVLRGVSWKHVGGPRSEARVR